MNHSESFGDMTQRADQSGSGDPQSSDPQSTAASPEETGKVEEADIDTTPEQPRSRFPLRRRQGWILAVGGIVLLVVAGLGWRWWQTSSAQEQPSEAQPAAIPVKIAPVRSGPIAESTEYVANFEAVNVVNLRPQIDGRVVDILVPSGARVRDETPIIQLGPAEQEASVESNAATIGAAEADINAARADISSARANVNAARADTNAAQADVIAAKNAVRALEAQRTSNLADLEFNLAQYRRNAQLFSEGAIARQNLDNFALQVKTAQATLAQTNADIKAQRSVVAQRQSTVNQRQAAVAQTQSTVNQTQATAAQREQVVRQNQANTRQQQAVLDYYRVIAPFDGTIGDILIKEGDYVTPETDLVRMTQNQSLEVNVSIPTERAPQLRLGLPVELIDPQGKNIGTSRISFIAPNVNSQTQSVLIKSIFNNSAGQIRTDEYTRARVIWSQGPGVSIPVTAVTRLGGETFVFVAEDGKPQQGKSQLIARQKPVELGPIQGNNYQVLKGLKPGERLITSGILQLRNGAAIAPES